MTRDINLHRFVVLRKRRRLLISPISPREPFGGDTYGHKDFPPSSQWGGSNWWQNNGNVHHHPTVHCLTQSHCWARWAGRVREQGNKWSCKTKWKINCQMTLIFLFSLSSWQFVLLAVSGPRGRNVLTQAKATSSPGKKWPGTCQAVVWLKYYKNC